jgi:hypothetical protein
MVPDFAGAHSGLRVDEAGWCLLAPPPTYRPLRHDRQGRDRRDRGQGAVPESEGKPASVALGRMGGGASGGDVG